MIAADTSSLIAYFSDSPGEDTQLIEDALSRKELVFPPMVLTELLSDAEAAEIIEEVILPLPLIEITEGFWARAGKLRSKVLSSGNKSRLSDALIAQGCIDSKIPLITRDRDFRHYVRFGLKLLP